jgi:hypothetical protein
MDNECSATVEKYIWPKAINIQLVPPHNHQANAAKRTIATFKEHFIAALTTVVVLCPLQLWDEFLLQVKLTLNILQPKPWYMSIQDHKLPGRHMQLVASTLNLPPTATHASNSTFLQCAASASPTPGA